MAFQFCLGFLKWLSGYTCQKSMVIYSVTNFI